MQLNPVLLEILNNKVAAVADEMFFALQRASRSAYVKEGADFGVALRLFRILCLGRGWDLARVDAWEGEAERLVREGLGPERPARRRRRRRRRRSG